MEIGCDARRENDQLIEYSNFDEELKKRNSLGKKIEEKGKMKHYVSLFETLVPKARVFKVIT
jgi:hypothetical protein